MLSTSCKGLADSAGVDPPNTERQRASRECLQTDQIPYPSSPVDQRSALSKNGQTVGRMQFQRHGQECQTPPNCCRPTSCQVGSRAAPTQTAERMWSDLHWQRY